MTCTRFSTENAIGILSLKMLHIFIFMYTIIKCTFELFPYSFYTYLYTWYSQSGLSSISSWIWEIDCYATLSSYYRRILIKAVFSLLQAPDSTFSIFPFPSTSLSLQFNFLYLFFYPFFIFSSINNVFVFHFQFHFDQSHKYLWQWRYSVCSAVPVQKLG